MQNSQSKESDRPSARYNHHFKKETLFFKSKKRKDSYTSNKISAKANFRCKFKIFFLLQIYDTQNISPKFSINVKKLPITEGSKSTKTALGTCLPAPVSAKNVEKESSPPVLATFSEGMVPSG